MDYNCDEDVCLFGPAVHEDLVDVLGRAQAIPVTGALLQKVLL